jgi:hypothetical protein
MDPKQIQDLPAFRQLANERWQRRLDCEARKRKYHFAEFLKNQGWTPGSAALNRAGDDD